MTDKDQKPSGSKQEGSEPEVEQVASEQFSVAVDGDIQLRAKDLAFSSPAGFLAFGFGSGLLTKAPGTMGTLAAVPIAVLLSYLNLNGIIFLLLAFGAGVWICEQISSQLGVKDYGGIVWDEMVAYWMVTAFIPFHWGWFVAAFVIFRAFDILKPWPISALDESLEGGWGIMLDDVLAAVYTILILAFVEQMMAG